MLPSESQSQCTEGLCADSPTLRYSKNQWFRGHLDYTGRKYIYYHQSICKMGGELQEELSLVMEALEGAIHSFIFAFPLDPMGGSTIQVFQSSRLCCQNAHQALGPQQVHGLSQDSPQPTPTSATASGALRPGLSTIHSCYTAPAITDLLKIPSTYSLQRGNS